MATSSVLNLDTDESLIIRIHAGDQDAMEEVYDRFASIIYSIALRVLRDPPAAARVMEEVFLYIWRNSEKCSLQSGSMCTWTAMLARNQAIDALREGKHARNKPVPIDRASVSKPQGRSFASVEVSRAMNSLPMRQQQLLALAFFDGQTPVQIADSTGASLSNVKLDIRNALLSLRASIASQLIPTRC